ncbi:hypothetical protein ATANTOWER_027280 [Ataeniobius toweri]|uniref:Uncharacterized protein n=1 Tax=Ataeniobius toweri TaxID=208326 RepID=A0ABU7AH64_9TELE|nr:hypothetical protein [Ataeniobius toweri]
MEDWSKIPPAVSANFVTNYRKRLISGIANQGFCSKYQVLLYQILVSCNKMLIKYLNRFCLKQMYTYNRKCVKTCKISSVSNTYFPQCNRNHQDKVRQVWRNS